MSWGLNSPKPAKISRDLQAQMDPAMSFSDRRYDLLGAADPIFGMRPLSVVDLKTQVPNIPNIGSLGCMRANHLHIAYQKKTWPFCEFDEDSVLNYFRNFFR
jgi:hypothetical protein